MAGDPWKKIKTFSSCEDLKEHIKAVHIFSKQKHQIICPMQGCAKTNVDFRHMKVLHGVYDDSDYYCQEPDSKNGICGCRIHAIRQDDNCEDSWLSCMDEHRLHHHGLGIEQLHDVESVYRRMDKIINYGHYYAW